MAAQKKKNNAVRRDGYRSNKSRPLSKWTPSSICVTIILVILLLSGFGLYLLFNTSYIMDIENSTINPTTPHEVSVHTITEIVEEVKEADAKEDAKKTTEGEPAATPPGNTPGAPIEPITGDTMIMPATGTTITVSPGIDVADISAVVSAKDRISYEFCVNYLLTLNKYKTLQSRVRNFLAQFPTNNKDVSNELWGLDSNGDRIYACAWVDGFGNPGDIAVATYENGESIKVIKIDAKSTQHTTGNIGGNTLIQCQYGHGYMTPRVDGGEVHLNILEFFCGGNRVKDVKSIVPKGRVMKLQIVGHVNI